MQLVGIDIKNFRGFNSIKVDDFGQLNLIVGRNNAGKTALLEALTLATASIEPEVILTLNKVREISDSGTDSFRGFFYNLLFTNSPLIESVWRSESQEKYSRSVQLIAKESLSYQLEDIDPRIRGVEVIGNRVLLDVEDAAKLMPLGLLGDGVKKVMSIMASVIDTDSSTIVLVDEIENGLHYSVHQELWKALILVIKETKAQLFITTHSLETLRYLNEALDGFPDFKEYVRCFDIVRTKKAGYQAYKYTYEGFAGALEDETEMRR